MILLTLCCGCVKGWRQAEWHCWCGSLIRFRVLTASPFLIATPSIVTDLESLFVILSTWVPPLPPTLPPHSTARDPSGLVPLMMRVLPTTSRVDVMAISTSTSISQVAPEAQLSMAFWNSVFRAFVASSQVKRSGVREWCSVVMC